MAGENLLREMAAFVGEAGLGVAELPVQVVGLAGIVVDEFRVIPVMPVAGDSLLRVFRQVSEKRKKGSGRLDFTVIN